MFHITVRESHFVAVKVAQAASGSAWFRTGFSASALLTLWGGEIFVVVDYSVHCRLFGSIPGLYPTRCQL